jgi:hypothetical protein
VDKDTAILSAVAFQRGKGDIYGKTPSLLTSMERFKVKATLLLEITPVS